MSFGGDDNLFKKILEFFYNKQPLTKMNNQGILIGLNYLFFGGIIKIFKEKTRITQDGIFMTRGKFVYPTITNK